MKYRSGFESDVAHTLEKHKIPYDYEAVTIPYTKKSRVGECSVCGSKEIITHHMYTPDFRLYPDTDKELWIETKGKFTARDRTKMKAVCEQYTDLDIWIVLQYDNWITSKHKSRYTDWCQRMEIKCLVKSLPLGNGQSVKILKSTQTRHTRRSRRGVRKS